MRKLFAILACLASPLAAQEIAECDWQASAQNIVEPWEENSRSFANGDVRLAFLDTIEPAAGYAYLLVLSPPYDELGGRQCRVIGAGDGIGFAGLDFANLGAEYDPAVGLVFEVPVDVFDPTTSDIVPSELRVTLNQSTGDVGVFFGAVAE